jgi:hypothetical protein
MDDSGLPGGYVGLAIGGGSVVGAVIMQVVNWFLNRKQSDAQSDAVIADYSAKTSLIEALEARIAASEARQNAQEGRVKELEERVTMEIDLRLKSQEENHRLRLRVTELEFAIRQLGGAVPTGVNGDITGNNDCTHS